MRIKAVSYNIHSGIGSDRVFAPERTLGVIRRLGADIVGLQEVDARIGKPERFDQFRFFTELAGFESVAGPNIVGHRGQYGNVLLTRWPIESCRLVDLSIAPREPRGAICAVLRCGAHRLQVVNTHLGLRVRERREQALRLLDAVRGHDGPVLFLGDFNVWRRRSALLAGLGAPVMRGSAPGTFPSWWPVLALDRIWTRPPSLLVSVRAVRDSLTVRASDHLPVEAAVELGAARR